MIVELLSKLLLQQAAEHNALMLLLEGDAHQKCCIDSHQQRP
jgi:hypothetical protein